MRAVVFADFAQPPVVRTVEDPVPPKDGVVIKVAASGLCRSDWHAWRGHDPNVTPPHVPGHELAGTIAELGTGVTGWRIGERVTVPFVCACGSCAECASGNQQVCARQFQPGSTHWGSFADYVAIRYAATNLVRLPSWIGDVEAAALGCRFGTAFRAVLGQGAVRAGEWLAVYGCGGAGLSAIRIAVAAGASVIAVDLSAKALELAEKFGARHTVHAAEDPAAEVRALTDGGAHVSLDCAGSAITAAASVNSLRPKGRHVQVGLLPGAVPIPMDRVIGGELRILGSHGIAAHEYPELLRMVKNSGIDLGTLVGRRIGIEEVPAALMGMDKQISENAGITVMELPG